MRSARASTSTGRACSTCMRGRGRWGWKRFPAAQRTRCWSKSNRRAATVLRGNVTDLGLPGAQVVPASVGAVLAAGPAQRPTMLSSPTPRTRLAAEAVAADLAALIAHGWLRSGCLIAVERATRSEPIAWPPGYGGRIAAQLRRDPDRVGPLRRARPG